MAIIIIAMLFWIAWLECLVVDSDLMSIIVLLNQFLPIHNITLHN